MRSTTRPIGALVAATLVTSLAACGSDNDVASTDAEASTTEVGATNTDPAVTTEQPTTDTPFTDTSSDVADTAASRAPAPPLEEPTELLVDGVEPLADVSLPGIVPPQEPGRYHSYRLGSEVVFSIPQPFNLGQHGAGTIGWDLDGERVFFISRWGADEPLTPDEWIAELLDSGWEVTETDVDPISGYDVRRFDITPTSQRQTIGGVQANGALSFGDGLPRRVWIIDQDDAQPLVVGSGISSDDWGATVDAVVDSLEIGPTLDDPRIGRERIEYGDFMWSATPGDEYRTLLFGDTIMNLPVRASGSVSAQFLSSGVTGGFSGTDRPTARIGAVGQLILPPDDPSAGIFASTIGDPPADPTAFLGFLESLAARGFISDLRDVDDTVTLLGETTAAVEFDVPNGGEVGAFVSAPDGWAGLEFFTLFPAHTYRMWVMPIDGQVAVVIAEADVSNTEDLQAATELATVLAASLETA